MSQPPVRLSIRAVRWWVRLYTASLPAWAREDRRAEIESDVWEQMAESHGNERGRLGTTAQVLIRTLLGLPSDVLWRLEVADGVVRKTAPDVRSWGLRLDNWGFLAIGVLLVTLSFLGGAAGILLGFPATLNEMGPTVGIVIPLLNGLAIAGAMWTIRRWPSAGVGLVVSAAGLFAMAWSWTILGPVLALLMGTFAVRKGQRVSEARHTSRSQ